MKQSNNKIIGLLTIAIASALAPLTSACASAPTTRQRLPKFEYVGTANWTQNESELAANQGTGFAVAENTYDNFYFKTEFLAGKNTNSGIFFRCQDSKKIDDHTCYEANIFDLRPDPLYRTGAITRYSTPKAILTTEDQNWHTYEIYAAGDKMRIIVDGIETAFLMNKQLNSGYLALQLAQGEIRFRNIEIKPISSHSLDGNPSVLDGVWELESMSTVDSTGAISPWCEGAFGIILYTNDYMSTAVNCTSDQKNSVIYSGSFHIEGQTVFHHVQNSSTNNIGSTFSREFKLSDEKHLELRGKLGTHTVIVKWARRN